MGLVLGVTIAIGAVVPSYSQAAEHGEGKARRVIEDEIAGLRPGKDAVDKAYHRFGKDFVREALSAPDSAVWIDVCNSQMLTVTFDRNDIIQDVTIQPSPGVTTADCTPRSYSRGVRSRMGGTRHGLVFRDRCDRVQEIYGAPQSQRDSTHGKKVLIYRYDLKGRSLSLEVTCDSNENYVEAVELTTYSPARP